MIENCRRSVCIEISAADYSNSELGMGLWRYDYVSQWMSVWFTGTWHGEL